MTNFVYRTVKHTGTKAVTPRTASTLVYRGVAHDGLGAERAQPARAVQMVYRGVQHLSRLAAPQSVPASGAHATADPVEMQALAA